VSPAAEEVMAPAGPDPAKVAAAHKVLTSEVAACVAELQQKLRLLAGTHQGHPGGVEVYLALATVPLW
jgi:hypothetical protein